MKKNRKYGILYGIIMRKIIQVVCISIFAFFANSIAFCIDISNSYANMSKVFEKFMQKHEGETSFRSLLIPSGGRYEGLAYAFTALSNDSSFFEANPAGSVLVKNTEINALHNNWIADSNLETITYTQRTNRLGWGGSLRCFYIPFTEYDGNGDKVNSGYYSETFITGNIAYNFLAGYDFKGLTIGGNLKLGLLSMPPFAGRSDTEVSFAEQKKRAKAQNGYAVLGDLGMILRANVLKGFYDDEPNFYFGLAFKNFGAPIKGDIPPAYIAMGFAYRPFSIFLFSFDVKQNVNLKNIKASGFPYGSLGLMFSITKYFNLLTGIGVKGGNPHFNVGGEINLKNIQIQANYNLDLASQTTALNRISVGVKISLGDRGRQKERDEIKRLYIEGLKEYNQKQYEKAIELWQEILKLDSQYDPAIDAIKIAERQWNMQRQLDKLLKLD